MQKEYNKVTPKTIQVNNAKETNKNTQNREKKEKESDKSLGSFKAARNLTGK